VLPYCVGEPLGAVWDQQATAVTLSGNLAACEARAQARSFLENDRLIDTGDIITGHRETCNNKVGRTVWALMTNLAPLRALNNVPARSIVRVVQQKSNRGMR
jgi:hypothetical protein